MSFCVDLWNGFEIIKEKFTTTHRHIKSFNKLINGLVSIEKEYCKNLDNIYKEFKDTGNLEYPIEQSRIRIIEMIDFESKKRKEFINYVNKNIIDKLSAYLSEPKISLDQQFLEASETTLTFNKSLNKLISKQEAFHSQCKELSSNISQFELENKFNNKEGLPKCQKYLSKVVKSREEYMLYLNETNIERKKYNDKMQELLNELEKIYRKTLEKFKEYLFQFTEQKYLLLKILYEVESCDYENYHSKIDIEKEVLLFIMKNVTKEFPMVKFEFCPLKQNSIGRFIKSKYRDKINEKDYNRVLKTIEGYFQKHNVFPTNLLQTGVPKLAALKSQNDFFIIRRFTKKEKRYDPSKKKLNTVEDKIRDKTPDEKEAIILRNVNFLKNYINEIMTEGKVKLIEDKLCSDNLNKIDNKKDEREKMDIGQKSSELFKLINKENESNEVYIEALIKVLSFLRSKGYFEINIYNYNLLQIIFLRILEENSKNDYMLKNIFILAQTFYKVEEDEKIYLQKGIKDNIILNKPQTWHRCINYSICLANTDRDLTIPVKTNELIKKINKEAYATVIAYLCDIKVFTSDENTFEKVKYFYSNIYNLDEKDINQNIKDYLENYHKKLKINKNGKNEIKLQIKVNTVIKEKPKDIKENLKIEEIKEEENKNEIKEEDNKQNEEKSEGNNNEVKEKENKIKEENDKNKIKEENNKNEIKEEEIKNEIKEEDNKNEIKEEEIKNEIKEEKKEEESKNEIKEEKKEEQIKSETKEETKEEDIKNEKKEEIKNEIKEGETLIEAKKVEESKNEIKEIKENLNNGKQEIIESKKEEIKDEEKKEV